MFSLTTVAQLQVFKPSTHYSESRIIIGGGAPWTNIGEGGKFAAL